MTASELAKIKRTITKACKRGTKCSCWVDKKTFLAVTVHENVIGYRKNLVSLDMSTQHSYGALRFKRWYTGFYLQYELIDAAAGTFREFTAHRDRVLQHKMLSAMANL